MKILFAAYLAVLVAELVGDKTIYTLGALASRYRVVPVLVGASVAFMGKSLAAVLFGRFIATLPPWLIATTSAVTFLVMAIVLWRKRPTPPDPSDAPKVGWPRAMLVGFSSIFFSEWADVGQITTALLVAQYHQPVDVWVGATLAMVTKSLLAVTLGLGLRRWVPVGALRAISVSICLVMAALAVLRID